MQKKTLNKIFLNKYDIDKYIVTKTLREKYANRTSIVHAVLADRMAQRDPGNRPMPNDRIPYVYIQMDHEVELQGERVEHPDYVIKNDLKLDHLFYITNQIMKPCIQFLELLVENPEDIFKEYIMREENRRNGLTPVNYYMKQIENQDTSNIKSKKEETVSLMDDIDCDIMELVGKKKSRTIKKSNNTTKNKNSKSKIDLKPISDDDFCLE